MKIKKRWKKLPSLVKGGLIGLVAGVLMVPMRGWIWNLFFHNASEELFIWYNSVFVWGPAYYIFDPRAIFVYMATGLLIGWLWGKK